MHKKPEEPKHQSRDFYDKARQSCELLNRIGASGDLNEPISANFLAATGIIEALLAVADAVYVSRGLVRKTKE